jgi:predicted DNA-binding protein
MAKLITKSIRLHPEEDEILKRLSQQEGGSEAALLRRFVREGMDAYRLEQAVTAYQRGEADLSAAAQFAGVSVYHMMNELKRRDVAPPAEAERFVVGLKTLVETFGGSDALQRTIETISSNA